MYGICWMLIHDAVVACMTRGGIRGLSMEQKKVIRSASLGLKNPENVKSWMIL